MRYGSYGSQVRRHEKFVVGVKNDHGKVQTLIGNKPPLMCGQNKAFFGPGPCVFILYFHMWRRSGHPSLIHYLCGCFQDFVTFLPTRPLLTTWYLHLCPMYGGIITKKLRECPCLCRQYFISDIKDAALVDNDEGRAGQSILSSGPWGVVKTWIENNCQMLKMPRDGDFEWGVEQKHTFILPVSNSLDFVM